MTDVRFVKRWGVSRSLRAGKIPRRMGLPLMTPTSLLRTLCLASLLVSAPAWAEDLVPLKTAEAVRTLSLQDAAAARPVKLHGVVTYLAPAGPMFFLQDETGGVFVTGQRDRSQKADFRIGAVVDVEGITAAGRVVPHVTMRKKELLKVNVTGEAPLPEPKSATVAQLGLAAFQDVRVEVSGIVRSVATEPLGNSAQETLLLTLADGRNRVTVALLGWRQQGGLPQQLVGASVKVTGIYSVSPGERQLLSGNRLFITGMKEVQVEQPAEPAYSREPGSVVVAREMARDDNDLERVRLQGGTTVAIPGKGMYVEDGTGGIWVDSVAPATPGEPVDAVGFPAIRDGMLVLEDAMWRRSARTMTTTPPTVTAVDAMSGSLDGRLVQFEALLLAVSAAGEGPTLVLQSGERVFLARCGNPRMRLPSLGENSWLRVTGVCVNTHSPQPHAPGPGRPASFHLLIAGPQSIEIARTPSWWTVQRIVTVVASLAALALGATVWATTLRRRVAVQTGQIREHLAKEAVAEERLRIARELHDSVQQDLLGISMQLKATERLLESAPDKARHALSLASAMARHSQAETHRAVWDLREAANEHSDLVLSLDEMVAGMNTEEGARVDFSYTGERCALAQTVESQVLRVAQEAVTNAVKHGEASRIDLALNFGPDELTLMIRDDGKGFDAEHPPSANSGHFGLFGMKERAIKLNARLTLESKPGGGTTVRLEVPLPAETGVNESLQTESGLRLMTRPSTT